MISVDRKSNKNLLYLTLTISHAFALIDVVCSRITMLFQLNDDLFLRVSLY